MSSTDALTEYINIIYESENPISIGDISSHVFWSVGGRNKAEQANIFPLFILQHKARRRNGTEEQVVIQAELKCLG